MTNISLKFLNISENKIDDRGFKSFDELPLKNHTLENLDISKNLISVKNKFFLENYNKKKIKNKIYFYYL